MDFYTIQFNDLANFESAGIFVNNKKWKHSHRILSSFEIIVMIEGVLPIQVSNTQYRVKPNELLIIPPSAEHFGFEFTTSDIKFIWIHFNCSKFKINDEKSLFLSNIENSSIILPNYSNKLDVQRIILMSNHLLGITQENVNSIYLNLFLNSTLHEINYQTQKILKERQLSNLYLQPVREFIRINCFEDIDLGSIATHFNYNKSYLSRKYKKVMGIGIKQQINKFRISRAEYLLSNTSLTVQEISSQIGFNDEKYFMRLFRKNTNSTPSEYRKLYSQRHFNKE
jgi:YesN/AraC family two-component response regulator